MTDQVDRLNILQHTDVAGALHQVGSPEEWELRRAGVLASMQQVMGPVPGDECRCPLDMQVEKTEQLDGIIRMKISYASEPGDRVPAYLLMPEGIEESVPALVCLHQTTPHGKAEPAGVDGNPDLHYALELADKGYVTLAPDYWFGSNCLGEYQPTPYKMGYESGTMKGIWNHIRAVDLLQSLPQVDPARIGSIGHSLGGHNSLFLAAFDRRIKVVVSSCGFSLFTHYCEGDLSGWSHNGYMPRIASEYGVDASRMPFDFAEALAAAAPAQVFINAPLDDMFDCSGVEIAVNAARPVHDLLGSSVEIHCPDCGHEFPVEIRKRAYSFIDERLK